MTDNLITIYLDSIAYKRIIQEQELFKTGKNKSEIIKKIIINHYSKYEININELKQKIKDTIINESGKHQFNEDEYLNIAWKITKYLAEKTNVFGNETKKQKRKINIRKNKKDSELEFILDSCPKNASESEYLANIIYSYLKEPQYEREKIIFRDIIDTINKAIQNKQSIRIITKPDKKNRVQSINPKEICTSQEGLYNYLLYQGYSDKAKKYYASTIHIYNILSVYLDINHIAFQSDIEEQFNKMKRNGVQFSINGDTVYKVKLTKNGEVLFKSRYLERPVPLPKSDENIGIYYFDCSEMQFKSYFAPFRKDVIILEPEEMIGEIVQEYKEAMCSYQSDNISSYRQDNIDISNNHKNHKHSRE